MTKDEALKMAIEALEDASCMAYSEFSIENEYENVINACKEALEQPAQTYIVNNTAGTQFQLHEQPAQEPLAWMSFPRASQVIPMREFHEKKIFSDDVALYPHPHQWQGLTDEEIDALEHNDFTCWGRDDLIVFGRAIEQALKDKNT